MTITHLMFFPTLQDAYTYKHKSNVNMSAQLKQNHHSNSNPPEENSIEFIEATSNRSTSSSLNTKSNDAKLSNACAPLRHPGMGMTPFFIIQFKDTCAHDTLFVVAMV
mmetsp:Transcript_27984/g.41641  ORF Transcript_27984/g.41641 Transcript_27984/m.41641 type:complete len:108 (-) Transcript_27984:1009-1332(-)